MIILPLSKGLTFFFNNVIKSNIQEIRCLLYKICNRTYLLMAYGQTDLNFSKHFMFYQKTLVS